MLELRLVEIEEIEFDKISKNCPSGLCIGCVEDCPYKEDEEDLDQKDLEHYKVVH